MMCRSTLRWPIVSDISEVVRELEVGADRDLKKTTTRTRTYYRNNNWQTVT